jgi:hypothetical protein
LTSSAMPSGKLKRAASPRPSAMTAALSLDIGGGGLRGQGDAPANTPISSLPRPCLSNMCARHQADPACAPGDTHHAGTAPAALTAHHHAQHCMNRGIARASVTD